MTAGDTQPTQPLPEWAYAEPEPERRRRRVWPWIVGGVILVALVVAAVIASEWIARALVAQTIRDQARTHLDLAADHPIDVDVPGLMLPQLIAGTLGEVRVASDDVTLGPMTADVALVAHDVPITGAAQLAGADAVVQLDEAQLQALLETVDGFPDASVAIEAPNVTASMTFNLFGAQIPIGVALTPTAADGDIVLTPAAIELGGVEISAEQLQNQFGIISNTVLRDWPVCIAEHLPAAVTLTDIAVEGDELVAQLDVGGEVLADLETGNNGTCD